MSVITPYFDTNLTLEAWNYAPPTVAAPTNLRTTGTTSSTISLAWNAAAGTYTLQRAPVTAGTPGTFATIYTGTTASYTDGPLTFNTTYAYRVLVTVNGVASQYSAVLQATTATSTQPSVFTPQSNEFRHNKRNDTSNVATGFVRRDALAAWPLNTNATALLVRGKTSGEQGYVNAQAARIDVYVGGSFFTSLILTQRLTEQEFSVTGLPAGNKLVEFYDGSQYRPGEQGEVFVTILTGVTVPAGFTGSVAPLVKTTEGIAIFGNSRTVGGGVADPARSAFTRQLGRSRGSDTYLLGYASLQLGVHIVDATAQDALVAEYVARLTGYTKQRILLGPDSENEYGYSSYSPAQIQAAYQQAIPKLQTQLPQTKIYIGTTFSQKNGWGGANALGFTQQDYYNMEKGIAAGFSNVYTLDYMAAGLTPADYADDSHLNESGEAKLATYTAGIFDASDNLAALNSSQFMSLDSSGGAQTLLQFTTSITDPEYAIDQLNGGAWQSSNTFLLYNATTPSVAAGTYTARVRSISNNANTRSKQIQVAETITPDDARNTYSPNWNTAAGFQFSASPFSPKKPGNTSQAYFVRFPYNGVFEFWTRQQQNVDSIGLTRDNAGQRFTIGVAGGPGDYSANIGLTYHHNWTPAEGADTMQVDGNDSPDFLWGYRLQYPPT
jgi:hypothetical protein